MAADQNHVEIRISLDWDKYRALLERAYLNHAGSKQQLVEEITVGLPQFLRGIQVLEIDTGFVSHKS